LLTVDFEERNWPINFALIARDKNCGEHNSIFDCEPVRSLDVGNISKKALSSFSTSAYLHQNTELEIQVERGAPGDGVVIIAARREGPEWTLRWNLANGEQNWSWRSTDQELMYALSEGVHRMTDLLASSNTITVSEAGNMSAEFAIGGLNGANAYMRCLDYLQNLSLVTAVEILGASPGRVHFRLQLNASYEDLVEAFYRSSVLSPARTGSDYEYEYLP
jgi:hypothetical protein